MLNGGTTTASAGAALTDVSIEGGATLTGSATASSAHIAGGTIKGTLSTDELFADYGEIDGPGVVTVNSGGTGVVSQSSALTLNTGGKLVNLGSTTVDGQISLSNASQVENGGALALTDSANVSISDNTNNKVLNDASGTISYRASRAALAVSLQAPFTNNGTVTVARGQLGLPSLTNLTAAGKLTGGTYQALGGTINLANAINNNAANLVLGTTGGFVAGGVDALPTIATNSGSLTFSKSETFTPASLANTGAINVLAGTTKLGTLNQTAGSTSVASGATLRSGSGAGNVLITGGTLTGNGTVAGKVSGSGTVQPARAAATPLAIASDYTPDPAAGTLAISIGGTTSGTGYGALTVGGTATLGGTLALQTDIGYDPPNGSTYTILTANAVSGTFSSVTGTTAGAHTYVVNYSPTQVTVTVIQAPAITSASTTTFYPGAPSSFTVTTTGFPTPTITETGSLPSGVTFTDNGDGTATLAGDGTEAPGSTRSRSMRPRPARRPLRSRSRWTCSPSPA